MGEKLATLGQLNLAKTSLVVELNEGVTSSERIIHIQSESFRLEMSEKDFIAHSLSILHASKAVKKKTKPK